MANKVTSDCTSSSWTCCRTQESSVTSQVPLSLQTAVLLPILFFSQGPLDVSSTSPSPKTLSLTHVKTRETKKFYYRNEPVNLWIFTKHVLNVLLFIAYSVWTTPVLALSGILENSSLDKWTSVLGCYSWELKKYGWCWHLHLNIENATHARYWKHINASDLKQFYQNYIHT